MARAAPVTPATRMKKDIEKLISDVSIETGWTERQISEKLGKNQHYLRNAKAQDNLLHLPVIVLMQLAWWAGREMSFNEARGRT